MVFVHFRWKKFLRRSALNRDGLLPLLSDVRLSDEHLPDPGRTSSSSDPKELVEQSPRPSWSVTFEIYFTR
jgi:hypothetical protein